MPSLVRQRADEKRQARETYPALVEAVAGGEELDQGELNDVLTTLEIDSGDFQESVRREKIRRQIAQNRRQADRHSETAQELASQREDVEQRIAEREARFNTVQAEYQNLQDKDTEALADVAAHEKRERELAEALNRQADERERKLAGQPAQRPGVPKGNSAPV